MPRKKSTGGSRKKSRKKDPLTIASADTFPPEEPLSGSGSIAEGVSDSHAGEVSRNSGPVSAAEVVLFSGPASAAEVIPAAEHPPKDTVAAEKTPFVEPLVSPEPPSIPVEVAQRERELTQLSPAEFRQPPQDAIPQVFPQTPTPHGPTPRWPMPHLPTPTPHWPTPRAPAPTPHWPTPHPPTPPPNTGFTGTTGDMEDFSVPLRSKYPEQPYVGLPAAMPATTPARPMEAAVSTTLTKAGNTVAIMGVIGLAALMGMLAAAGIVALVAINKEQ